NASPRGRRRPGHRTAAGRLATDRGAGPRRPGERRRPGPADRPQRRDRAPPATPADRVGLLAFRCEVAQVPSQWPISCTFVGRVPAPEHARTAAALATLAELRLCVSTTG